MTGSIEYQLQVETIVFDHLFWDGLFAFEKFKKTWNGSRLTISFTETAETEYFDVILFFVTKLQANWGNLQAKGFSNQSFFILILYAYKNQCNIEFSAVQLKAIGDLGIGLGISCWQV